MFGACSSTARVDVRDGSVLKVSADKRNRAAGFSALVPRSRLLSHKAWKFCFVQSVSLYRIPTLFLRGQTGTGPGLAQH